MLICTPFPSGPKRPSPLGLFRSHHGLSPCDFELDAAIKLGDTCTDCNGEDPLLASFGGTFGMAATTTRGWLTSKSLATLWPGWKIMSKALSFDVKNCEDSCATCNRNVWNKNNCWISRLVGFFGGSSRLAWLSCVGPFVTIEDSGFGGWRGKKWCWFGEVWTTWSSFLHQLCPWSLASTTGPPGHLFQWWYSHPGGSLMPFDLMWKTLWWRACAKNSWWVTRRDFSIKAPWRFSCAWSRWWGWSASTRSTLAHGKSESVPLLLHQLLHQQRDLAKIVVQGKVTFQFSYEVCTDVSSIVVPRYPFSSKGRKVLILLVQQCGVHQGMWKVTIEIGRRIQSYPRIFLLSCCLCLSASYQ